MHWYQRKLTFQALLVSVVLLIATYAIPQAAAIGAQPEQFALAGAEQEAMPFLGTQTLAEAALAPQEAELTSTSRTRTDFNGDYYSDTLWRHATQGYNSIWFINSNRIASIWRVTDTNWRIVAHGDYNGDDRADILWRHATLGYNAIWFMSGSTVSSVATLPRVSDRNWQVVAGGDMNRDGRSDIIWRHTVYGYNAIWQMNRQSVTILGLPRASDTRWQVIGSGDFDGNGRADMIWRHATSGSNALWLFTSSGIVSAGLPQASDLNWRMVSSGDLNGDRISDIVWRHTTCGCNVAWFFSGGRITSVGLPRVADPNWRIVAGGDYNGDSKGDLLWRHSTYGYNAAWLMSGSRVATSVALGRTTDLNWQLIGDSRVGLGAIEGPFSVTPDAEQAPITEAQALAELSGGPLSEMAVEAAGPMEVTAATADAPTLEGAPETITLISDELSPTPDAQTRVFLPLLGR